MDIDYALVFQTFREEAEEQFVVLEHGLVALETRPEDSELLAEVFRAAHTFKGNASTVGLHALAARAHALEDALEAMRTGGSAVSPAKISALLQLVDELRTLAQQAESFGDVVPTVEAETVAGLPRPQRRTLRIASDKLDRMLNLSGEISIARGRIRVELANTGGGDPSACLERALEMHLETDRLQRELQDEIMQARMVPVGPGFRQYQRLARDIALQHGKQVQLSLTGEDVEIDSSVSEQVKDPLMHMLRNAIDHGIETPATRVASGKSPVGQLTLGARRDGSSIFIELSDDGAGLDKQRIAERAQAMGRSDVATLSEDALLRLVMEPGFSTADQVSDLSGRGVGMDVVRRNVEALRGAVEIASRAGAGTTIALRLPLTLAIIDGFFVEVGSETYVLPLDSVVECIELPHDYETRGDASGVHNFRGQALPYLRLRSVFGLPPNTEGREHLAIVKHGNRHAGIAVDTLLGQDQAVIKPLAKVLRAVPAISGSTITSSGHVALILDVAAILRLAEARSNRSMQAQQKSSAEVTAQ
jgi:two-component system, chemotaxis family, sensor kinase CheA